MSQQRSPGSCEPVEVVDAEPVETGTEIVKVEPVLHPVTGELIALPDAPTDRLAELRDAFVAAGHELRAAARAVDRELAQRLDHEGTRSTRIAGWKLTVAAPTKTSWDGHALYLSLRALVRAGLISDDARVRCVRRRVVYETTHGELVKLERHADERVRAAVAAGKHVDDVEERRVTVTRERA